jgi:hypothetical protein
MDEDERIRQRAHKIWEEEGRPEGRSEMHWQMARQLIAMEDAPEAGLKPNPLSAGAATGEPVEEAAIMENLGEFPTLTDQGEEQTAPRARRAQAPAEKSSENKKAEKKPASKRPK